MSDLYQPPQKQTASDTERRAARGRSNASFVFVVLGVLGGIAGREEYGTLGALGIAAFCGIIATLLALTPDELERIDDE